MKSFSIEEAVLFGWHSFKARPWFFIAITALTIFVSSIGNNTDEYELQTAPFHVTAVFGLVALLAALANLILSIGSQKIFLKTEAGEKPEFKELFAHANLFFKVLFGIILYILIVLGGLILFIVPGIIFAIRYGFQYILIIDRGMGPIEALKESAKLTRGIRWHLLLFAVALGLVNVLGVLALGVGLLVSVPVTNLAIVHVYKKLLSHTQALPFTS